MGFFSWKCAKSGESIANRYSQYGDSYRSNCHLVTPKGTFHEENYEGYGVFGGVDIYELLGNGDKVRGINFEPKFEIKIVLDKYYNGETYDELKSSSESCEYQGYFYD